MRITGEQEIVTMLMPKAPGTGRANLTWYIATVDSYTDSATKKPTPKDADPSTSVASSFPSVSGLQQTLGRVSYFQSGNLATNDVLRYFQQTIRRAESDGAGNISTFDNKFFQERTQRYVKVGGISLTFYINIYIQRR